MRCRLMTISLAVSFLLWSSPMVAMAELPAGVTQRMLTSPGVYKLPQGDVLAVGAGKITAQLSAARAKRLAGRLAERDARTRLGHFLFPEAGNNFSISMKGAQVVQCAPAPDNAALMLAALLVKPTTVQRLAERDPLEDYFDVRAAPIVRKLLHKAPQLADGGGMIFDHDGGWSVLAVGYAALPDMPDADAMRKAATIARMEAGKALTEAVYGSTVVVKGQEKQIVAQGPGATRLQEWATSQVDEQVTGVFSRAEMVAQWESEDNHVAVALLVSRPEIAIPPLELDAIPARPLHRLTMAPEWQARLLTRPWILSGGAALCPEKTNGWLLVVERATLKGDPVADRMQTPLLLETRARAQAAKYLEGVIADHKATDTDSLHITYDAGETVLARQISEKQLREGTLGMVQQMVKVGEWYSEDGKELFMAFAVSVQ